MQTQSVAPVPASAKLDISTTALTRTIFLIVWDTDADQAGATAMIEGMLNDPNLGKMMEEAGVIAKPEFWVS